MIDFLGRITISRLTLYGLMALLAQASVVVDLRLLPYAPLDLGFSAALILAACWGINAAFARVFAVRSNPESVLITALILVLVITPFGPEDTSAIGFALFASAWAMASKYMLPPGGRHIFNPAAFGMALAALALDNSVSWWIGGSLYFLPVMLIMGALILRKMRCYDLFFSFAATALATVTVTAGRNVGTALTQVGLHSMFLFFAFIMLTEPRTAPLGRARRIAFGALVGVLFAPEVHVGTFYFTPELALLAGNVLAALSSPRRWTQTTRRHISKGGLAKTLA